MGIGVGFLIAVSVASFGATDQFPEATPGYTLFAPNMSTTTYLIDNDGNQVHTWESQYTPGNSVYLLENGHLLRTCNLGPAGSRTFHGGGAGGLVQELDWDGEVLWEYRYANDDHLLHHDIEPMQNGNVLMIAWERKTRREAIAAGRDPETVGQQGLWVDHVIEVKPTRPTGGEIVWEWHLWDHLVQDHDPDRANHGDPAKAPGRVDLNPFVWRQEIPEEELEQLEALGYLAASPKAGPGGDMGVGGRNADFTHTNAIDYNPKLDQIVLSVFGFSELWIIDHGISTEEARGEKGDLLYRWGNPRAYRAGTEADQVLYKQHDVQWIAEGLPGAGNLLIFNNGLGRPDGAYSTVVEITPPVLSSGRYRGGHGRAYGPAKPTWVYEATPRESFYSMNISGVHRLPTGNTLVCSGAPGILFEVTRDGEEVWRYKAPAIQPSAQGRPGGPGGPGGQGRQGRPGAPFGPPSFKDLDKNGDGKIVFAELPRMPFMNKEFFKRIDRDQDGSLSPDEFPPRPPADMAGPGMMGPPPNMGPPPGAGQRGPGMGPGGPGGPGGMGTSIFRARRYTPDYPGLTGKDLTPSGPIDAATVLAGKTR